MGKRGRPRKVPLDPGTEETLDRLEPPIWADWPNELKLAALAIDRAVRLISQSSMAHAQDCASIGAPTTDSADWPDGGWQEKVYKRYRAWCRAMDRYGFSVKHAIGVISLGETSSPWGYNDIYDGLELFAGLDG